MTVESRDNDLGGLWDDDDAEERDAVEHPYSDLGNARRLVAAHGQDLRYAPQIASWMAWDGHRWAEDITGEAQRRAKAIVDAMVTELAVVDADKRKALFAHWMRSQGAGRIEAMAGLARTEPGTPVLVAELDADPWALNTRSGVVDLRSGEISSPERRQLVTKLAPVHVDPGATCPTWKWFVDWAMCGDADLVGFLQRAVGYSLTGLVGEQVMFFCHGDGENGKTTFLGAIERLVGDYAMAADADLLLATHHEQHPTGTADLIGRRFVTATETEEGRRFAESTLKQLTGGDTIKARRMRQDFFQFAPTHKIWMAANHRPQVRGTDHAIWRRIRLIPWNAKVAPGERDERLKERLAAELPGILNWALEGCRAWQQGGLAPPEAVVAATAEYRCEQDHVGRFIEDVCLVGDGWKVSARELRSAYEAWCQENGERAWSARAMAPQLVERGCERFQEGHSKAWTWRGLSLASAPAAADRPMRFDDEIF
jgi:putative DNA primase/helicase